MIKTNKVKSINFVFWKKMSKNKKFVLILLETLLHLSDADSKAESTHI
jgi:hypothetical protein